MAEPIDLAHDDTSFEDILWPELVAMADGHAEFPRTKQIPGSALWSLYSGFSQPEGPTCVVGQLGQSLDGRIATLSGDSHYINGPEAIRHVHRLRALADAVIVGVGTVLADDPRLTVRHGVARRSSPGPARIVIDPGGRLPADARLLANDGARVYAVQTRPRPRPAGVTAIDLQERQGLIDPHDIVAALAALGYRRVLVEGGAATVSAFLAAGALDRLHLCVAPLVIGSGKIGISLPPVDRLRDAMRPPVSVHRLGADVLFDCDLARRCGGQALASSALHLVEG